MRLNRFHFLLRDPFATTAAAAEEKAKGRRRHHLDRAKRCDTRDKPDKLANIAKGRARTRRTDRHNRRPAKRVPNIYED